MRLLAISACAVEEVVNAEERQRPSDEFAANAMVYCKLTQREPATSCPVIQPCPPPTPPDTGARSR